jgi:hypothetical protein
MIGGLPCEALLELICGTARMAALTPEERKELAKKAIQARWAKAKKKKRIGAGPKPRE